MCMVCACTHTLAVRRENNYAETMELLSGSVLGLCGHECLIGRECCKLETNAHTL